MNLGTAQIIQGNALSLPLPDSSVDLICTSPPYFGLRSYQDGCPDCSDASRAHTRGYMQRYCPNCGDIPNRNVCPKCGVTTLRTEATKQALRKTDCVTCGGTGKGHYDGQIGSEATPAEFLDALLAATQEMVRVLKPSGSIFVNLGDKYASDGISGPQGSSGLRANVRQAQTYGDTAKRQGRKDYGVCAKSLMGIPWRYAIACIDQLGLILRAEIIWSKPNGLPESVTDRVRRSHEQWFHFTKQPRYFSSVDEIREATTRVGLTWEERKATNARTHAPDNGHMSGGPGMAANPLGKLPGSVWSLPNGVSPIRSILDAVAAGGITPEEGERLWTHLSGSYHTLTRQETAGFGLATATLADTERPQRASTAKTGRTASPTNSLSGQSQQGSPSTISAATSHVSTPSTLSQSPDERTSAEPAQSEPSASMDIHSLTHTLKSLLQDSPASDVASALAKSSGDSESSVWNVPTQPLQVPPELGIDHFAAYPMEFPRRIIQGWTPNGVCTQCGEGRRPARSYEEDTDGYFGPPIEVRRSEPGSETAAAISAYIKTARQMAGRTNSFDVTEEVTGKRTGACANWEKGLGLPEPEHWRKLKVSLNMGTDWDHIMLDTVFRPSAKGKFLGSIERHRSAAGVESQRSPGLTITGYMCGCPTPNAPTTPAVVLDPFGGTGTTALVAKALGRTGITIDLSKDYCRLAKWRCNDPRELAAALQVEKPEPVHPDQLDLFSGIE